MRPGAHDQFMANLQAVIDEYNEPVDSVVPMPPTMHWKLVDREGATMTSGRSLIRGGNTFTINFPPLPPGVCSIVYRLEW